MFLDWWYWWMFVRGNLGATVFFGVKFRQRILEQIANKAVSVSFAANFR